MPRRMIRTLSLVAALAFTSCATMPTQEQTNATDYGPFPTDYQEIVKKYMGARLLDPYSAVYSDWTTPTPGYAGDRLTGFEFGYRLCVTINAKNRMGGYVGARPHHFVIRNGSVVKMYGGDEPGSIDDMLARKMCG